MKIIIETIPNKDQRFPTCGDYWFDGDGTMQIRVSHMADWRHEALVAAHELVELFLTKAWCVAEPDILAFDKMFEAEREAGLHSGEDEPGDDPRAPYKNHHFTATTIERIMARELGVDWNEYDKAVMSL